jgi:hypothetical protein
METGADERFISYDAEDVTPIDCVGPVKVEDGDLAAEEGRPEGGGGQDHNKLSNLQGGLPNERYHVTRTIYNGLINANNPSTSNPFATITDVTAASGQTPTNQSFIMV